MPVNLRFGPLMTRELRQRLVATALEWQRCYGVAPAVTSALSEYDAARLVGMLPRQYGCCMRGRTAVGRGHDFVFQDLRFQVKANRPSGRKGSKVSKLGKPANLDWDVLIWILYDTQYRIAEAWKWRRDDYERECHELHHLRPPHIRNVAAGAIRLK